MPTMRKSIRTASGRTTLAATLLIVGTTCFAQMIVKKTYRAPEIIAYYNAAAKNRELIPQEQDNLAVAKLAVDAFAVDAYKSPFGVKLGLRYYQSELVSKDLSHAMTAVIYRIGATRLAASKSMQLKENMSLIEQVFGSDSEIWGWYLYQQGDSNRAQEIVLRSFGNEYRKIISMNSVLTINNSVRSTADQRLLERANFQFALLKQMTHGPSRDDLEKKMLRLKMHVHELPSHRIMS